jgi:hypothetical protein
MAFSWMEEERQSNHFVFRQLQHLSAVRDGKPTDAVELLLSLVLLIEYHIRIIIVPGISLEKSASYTGFNVFEYYIINHDL